MLVTVMVSLYWVHSSSTGLIVLQTKKKFAEALKQDEDGTFPIARKLVDLAKYYGFDGYFINQETTGDIVTPLGRKCATSCSIPRNIQLKSIIQ